MKNTLFPLVLVIIGMSILLGSCEKEEINEPEREPFNDTLVFAASKKEVTLFEPLSFEVATNQKNNEKGGLAYYLGLRLDSIKWELPDILNEVYSGTKMTIKREQCFYLPGKYKARITGYRDSIAVSSDSVEVEVKPGGDFLGIEWANDDITMQAFRFTSLVKGFSLDLTYTLTEEPYILLSYTINHYTGREEFKEEMAAIRPFFYTYITSLYGASAFNYEGKDVSQSPLQEEYEERFLNTLADPVNQGQPYYPIAIWDTPGCHIALVGSVPTETGEIPVSYFKIIAEPLKFHF